MTAFSVALRGAMTAAYNNDVIYRDERGIEYVSVPLPTHEVTQAVAVDARIVSRATARKQTPVYTGTDGSELAAQPRSHRRRWTDRQWLAFEEHRRQEVELAQNDEPAAAVWVVRPHGHVPPDSV